MGRAKLTKNSIIVFAATFVSSMATFIFQIMMGRAMTLDNFGQLSALFSIQMIISIVVGALILLYTRHTARFWTLDEKGKTRSLYSNAWKTCGAIGAACAVVLSVTSVFWSAKMNITSFASVVAISVLIAAYFLQSVPLAFVRGLQKFHLLGAGLGTAGILKLLLGVFIIYAGVTVPGAIFAVIVAVLLSIVVMHATLWPWIKKSEPAETGLKGKEMFSYAFTAMAGTFLPTFFINADMILIRSLFPSELSGYYAVFMVIGKVIFLCGSVVTVALFPAAVSEDAEGGKKGNELVFHAMILILVGGGAVVAVSFLYPVQLLEILFNKTDGQIALLLPWYSLFVLAVALIYMEAHQRLARGQYGFLWLAGAAAVAQVAGIYHFSYSLGAIIKFQAALFWAVFALRFLSVLIEGRRNAARAVKK